MKIYALIIARGGSKTIKNKNLVKVNKFPLIKYVLKEASKSKYIEKTFIMTDSVKIKNTVNNFKLNDVEVMSRSKKSATDTAQSEIAINEFINKVDCELIVFIQLTNIFIKSQDIDLALNKYFRNNYDSLLSVIKADKFLWSNKKSKFLPVNYDINKRPLKQHIKENYLENGSFYIFKRKNFKKFNNRLHNKIGIYAMKKESFFDIDNYDDLKIVRKIFSK